VNNFVVHNEFTAVIAENKHADAATAIVEGIANAVGKAALIKNWKVLLDVSSLGHSNDVTLITDVEDTILLEDRAKHVLNNDRWRWVRDEARLLMKLLGEEVDTEITVLAGLSRSGDADDLARATLQNQEIANANVVARDGDGVGMHGVG